MSAQITPPTTAVSSSALPSGAATSAEQDAAEALLTTIDADTSNLSVVGGGTEAAAIRVTIASDSTGVVSVDDNGGAITVDGTVAVTGVATEAKQDTAITALQLIDNLVLAEDAIHATADPGVQSLAVRKATPANLSGADGDYEPLQVSAGRLWASATIDAALPAGNANIGDVDVASIAAGDNNIGNVDIVTMPNVTLAAGTNTNEVVGDIAHDTGVGGNPVQIAGAAQDSDDTAPPNRVSAESDVTRLATDRDGALFVRSGGPQNWSYHLDTSTAQTDASVHAAPGAGLSLYVGTIVFSSGAATAINLFFEEGATKVLGPFYLEAVAGRGMAVTFNPPKKITANTALTLTTSAAIAHSVDVTGFTAQG